MDRAQGSSKTSNDALPCIAESPSIGSSTAWTASRCHRLLRPLTSKLAILRRNKQLLQTRKDGGIRAQNRVEEDHDNLGPSLLPRKRLRRTYSNRDRERRGGTEASLEDPGISDQVKLGQSTTLPRKLHIQHQQCLKSTGPRQLRRSHTGLHKIDESQRPARVPIETQSKDYQKLFSRNVAPESWELTQGLYTGLNALLKATNSRQPCKGAKSLFSSCLRKVPEHIIEEQRQADHLDPDSHIDVSAAVYEDLESFGSIGNDGWKPLREVLRAHGISLLSNAIRDGVIDHVRARGLVIICIQQLAHDEGEKIVEAMLAVSKPLRRPRCNELDLFIMEESQAIYTLHYFETTSHRRRFFFAQMARLISNGKLPMEWISSRDLVSYWNSALASIAANDHDFTEALSCVKALLALSVRDDCDSGDICLCGMQQQGISRTANYSLIEDRLSKFNTLHDAGRTKDILLQSMVMHAAMDGRRCSGVYTFMSEMLALFRGRSGDLIHQMDGFTSKVLLAATLCTKTLPRDQEAFHILLNDCDHIKTATTFISQIARSCCLIDLKSFDHVKALIEGLTEHHTTASEGKALSDTLDGIAVNAALEFGETTNNEQQLVWALSFAEKLGKRGVQTNRKTPKRLAFAVQCQQRLRWEEGLSEWVAKTPCDARTSITTTASEPNPTGSIDLKIDSKLQTATQYSTADVKNHLQELSPCAPRLNYRKPRRKMLRRSTSSPEVPQGKHCSEGPDEHNNENVRCEKSRCNNVDIIDKAKRVKPYSKRGRPKGFRQLAEFTSKRSRTGDDNVRIRDEVGSEDELSGF